MSEYRSVLERAGSNFAPLDLELERILRGRDRKRRNQRIAAGVVGIAVFVAAVGIVTTVGSFDRTREPAVPGGAVTGPTGTPTVPPGAGWDGVGFPPEGAAPSTPQEGKLVAHYHVVQGAGYAYVYADGRVISHGGVGNQGRDGIYERRLTPEGVELVRSGAVEAERFQLSSDPVPADAWEDPEPRPYVPYGYAICLDPTRTQAGIVRLFPPEAEALLRGKETMFDGAEPDADCFEVTTAEARNLDEVLDLAGFWRGAGIAGGFRRVNRVDKVTFADDFAYVFLSILPHGTFASPGPNTCPTGLAPCF